eukprot:766865-Amphidinium_carterae.2
MSWSGAANKLVEGLPRQGIGCRISTNGKSLVRALLVEPFACGALGCGDDFPPTFVAEFAC